MSTIHSLSSQTSTKRHRNNDEDFGEVHNRHDAQRQASQHSNTAAQPERVTEINSEDGNGEVARDECNAESGG